MAFTVQPYSDDESGNLSRWIQEQFSLFQASFVQPAWDERWLGEFALANTETRDINPFKEFGFFQISCKEDAQSFALVHYNKSTPFLASVNIGSNVTTVLTTASRVNVGISSNQIRVENLSGAQRTFRAISL